MIAGAGVIGLEVAAAANLRGCDVSVVELQDAIASRFLPPEAAHRVRKYHEANGIKFHLGSSLDADVKDGSISTITLGSGEILTCDLLVTGIGITPAIEAFAKELELDHGAIRVDDCGRTSLDGVYAVGDATSAYRPEVDAFAVYETIDNAEQQAMRVAHSIMHLPSPPMRAPYAWSDQGELNIQRAGVCSGISTLRGDPSASKGTLLFFADERMVGCVTIGTPQDLAPARRLIEAQRPCTASEFVDMDTPLRTLAKDILRRH